MEFTEICQKKRACVPPSIRPAAYPCNVKCKKKYIQPSRVKSFAPVKTYCPPTKPIDANTTYYLSYLNLNHETARRTKVQPFRPTHNLDTAAGKVSDETTNKLSYKPNWNIVKTKAIVPLQRALTGQGPLQCITTAHHDYVPKYVSKPEITIPCGNIRTSTSPLDGRTTTGLSYVNPGPTEPVVSFKPLIRYCQPVQSIAKDTTQKLSYQPFRINKRETFPWAQKPIYRPPNTTMDGQTIYTKSYKENKMPSKEKPIVPNNTNIFPYGEQFNGDTVYRESYLPCDATPLAPIIPSGNIYISNQKLSTDTTNKLSYQAVWTEKRAPIIPCRRSMMGDRKIQYITTTHQDYIPKMVPRSDIIVPCNNIHISKQPLQDKTTTGLSYINPSPVEPVQSFKPLAQYYRPVTKIEGETINKLSYQPWTPMPKEDLPWARKNKYELPKEQMNGDTIYHMSYPAPGHYIEECAPVNSLSLSEQEDDDTLCPNEL